MRSLLTEASQTAIRNYFINPALEAQVARSSIRRNYATDPRGTAAGGWPQYINGAVAAVTDITDHPLGITTGQRITATGAVNSGAAIPISALGSATEWTASAYVKLESGDATGWGFAINGVGSQPSPADLVPGVWTLVRWTFSTAAANGAFGFRRGAAGNASLLISGVWIESYNRLSAYFDGTTGGDADLTPAWTGTANASTSDLLGYYPHGVQPMQLNGRRWWSSTTWSSSGTTSLRISPFSTGDSFATLDATQLPNILALRGKVMTLVGRVRILSLQTGSVHSVARGFRVNINTASGNVEVGGSGTPGFFPAPNAVGIWDVRRVFTVPTDATGWGFVRVMNGDGNPLGDDVFWDDIMLVEGDYSSGFYTGDSPRWKWDGLQNRSTSVGYLPSKKSVRNIWINPKLAVNSTGYGGSSILSNSRTACNDLSGVSWCYSGVTNGANGRIYAARPNSHPMFNYMTQNRLHGALFWAKVDAGRIYRVGALSNAGGTTYNSVTNLVGTGRWELNTITWNGDGDGLRLEIRVPDGATACNIAMTKVSVYDDAATMPTEFHDGDAPGWIWEGATGESSSIGEPWTLDSIAGVPGVDIETPGTLVTLPGSSSNGPMSMYLVVEHYTDPGAFGDYNTGLNVNTGTGIVGTNAVAISRTSSAGITNVRVDTGVGAGQANQTQGLTGSGIGRHIVTARLNDGLTQLRARMNNAAVVTRSINTGTLTRTQARLDDSSANQAGKRFSIFWANHDDATEALIRKWMANKYGLAA